MDDVTTSTEHIGGSDPARSMALLWRTRDRPNRSGLSVDRIVTAAIDIADADGLAALSMRRVAERLGVGAMSLYTHVPGKSELVDLMLDTIYGEMAQPDPPPGAPPGAWRERLEYVARENHALYLRHPWLLQVATSRPVLGPNLIAKYDYELRAIEHSGLSDVDMDSVLTLMLGYVHGAARGAVDAATIQQRTGMTDEQWWHATAPHLTKVFDGERFPTATRVGQAAGEALQAAYDPAQAFEFGLQRVLDGIEAFIARENRA